MSINICVYNIDRTDGDNLIDTSNKCRLDPTFLTIVLVNFTHNFIPTKHTHIGVSGQDYPLVFAAVCLKNMVGMIIIYVSNVFS